MLDLSESVVEEEGRREERGEGEDRNHFVHGCCTSSRGRGFDSESCN